MNDKFVILRQTSRRPFFFKSWTSGGPMMNWTKDPRKARIWDSRATAEEVRESGGWAAVLPLSLATAIVEWYETAFKPWDAVLVLSTEESG